MINYDDYSHQNVEPPSDRERVEELLRETRPTRPEPPEPPHANWGLLSLIVITGAVYYGIIKLIAIWHPLSSLWQ